MTTTTAPANVAPAFPLCATLATFLTLLYRQARGHGRAIVGSGRGAREVRIQAGIDIAHLPGWLLDELQFVTPDALNLTPSTFGDDRSPLDLTAAFVTITPAPEFGHTEQGMQWHVPAAAALDARARLDAFAVAPSVVIAGPWSFTAVWPLERPIRLDDVASKARAFDLQRRLWSALAIDEHATVTVPEPGQSSSFRSPDLRSDTLPSWSPTWPALPLPGSFDRSLGGPLVITFKSFADHRVDVDALEQALNAFVPTPAETGGQPRKVTK